MVSATWTEIKYFETKEILSLILKTKHEKANLLKHFSTWLSNLFCDGTSAAFLWI